jgi:CBS domain-containing protein
MCFFIVRHVKSRSIPQEEHMLVKELLAKKGHHVYKIGPKQSVFEAIKIMTEKNIGALLVMDGDVLMGVISERDYLNKVIVKGRASKDTHVNEIMSGNVISVSGHDNIEKCMSIMTEYKFRHLPVVDEDNHVEGVLSIGDLVKSIIDQQKNEINNLKQYIQSGYPG